MFSFLDICVWGRGNAGCSNIHVRTEWWHPAHQEPTRVGPLKRLAKSSSKHTMFRNVLMLFRCCKKRQEENFMKLSHSFRWLQPRTGKKIYIYAKPSLHCHSTFSTLHWAPASVYGAVWRIKVLPTSEIQRTTGRCCRYWFYTLLSLFLSLFGQDLQTTHSSLRTVVVVCGICNPISISRTPTWDAATLVQESLTTGLDLNPQRSISGGGEGNLRELLMRALLKNITIKVVFGEGGRTRCQASGGTVKVNIFQGLITLSFPFVVAMPRRLRRYICQKNGSIKSQFSHKIIIHHTTWESNNLFQLQLAISVFLRNR